MEARQALWDPRTALGLRPDGANATELVCVGTTFSSDLESYRCSRVLPSANLDTVNRLLVKMATRMPDQVNHNDLLQLAEICLCTVSPNPHRGSQEGAAIYRWTEMLFSEDCRLRASTPLVRPPRESKRFKRTKALTNLRPTTDLTIRVDRPNPMRYPTPTPMTPADLSRFYSYRNSSRTTTVTVPQNYAVQSAYELPLTPPDSATMESPRFEKDNNPSGLLHYSDSSFSRQFLEAASAHEILSKSSPLSATSPSSALSLTLVSPHSSKRLYPDSPRDDKDVGLAILLADSQAQTRELLAELSGVKTEMARLRSDILRLKGELVDSKGDQWQGRDSE